MKERGWRVVLDMASEAEARTFHEQARAAWEEETERNGVCAIRLVRPSAPTKPTGTTLVSRMLAAARHDGITHAHMVQRSGAWLLASNGRHVVGVECSDVGPSGADAKIAALLRDQVPDFKPTRTASVRDLLSHTPLISVAGVVVPAESLRLCLAVLPEGVERVGVRRALGGVHDPVTDKRVRMSRLALCAPGWRATIAPMRTTRRYENRGVTEVLGALGCVRPSDIEEFANEKREEEGQ